MYVLAGAFALMTAVFAVQRLAEAADYRDPYPFRTQMTRLAPVKALLAGETAVGYLSNLNVGDRRFTNLYFPTQYVLAPTLLVPLGEGGTHRLVLGNFTRQEDYAAIGKPLGLEVVREFPMGVVLYRRVSQGEEAAGVERGKP